MRLKGTFTERLYQASNAIMNQLMTTPYAADYPLAGLDEAARRWPEGPKDPLDLLRFLRTFLPQGPFVSLGVGTTGLERPWNQEPMRPQSTVEASLCVWDGEGRLSFAHDELATPSFPLTEGYAEGLGYAGLTPKDLKGARNAQEVASDALAALRQGRLPLIGQSIDFVLSSLGRDALGLTWTSEVPKGAEGKAALVGETPVFDLMALARLTFPYGFRTLDKLHSALTEVAFGSVPDPADPMRELFRKDRSALSYSPLSATGQNRSLRKALMVGQATLAARIVLADPELFLRLEAYLPEPIRPPKGEPRVFFVAPRKTQGSSSVPTDWEEPF